MKLNKLIFVIVFFIPLFYITDVYADYKASVINPTLATCNLVNGSTGFCFYENSNLNSVNFMKYLDTGDEVTVIESQDKIESTNKELCDGNYVYVSQYYPKTNGTYYGYYCDSYLFKSVLTDELIEEFTEAGFPESYFEKLATLKTAHPNWTFKSINTEINFNDAVNGELKLGHSLVHLYATSDYSQLSTSKYSFNYYDDYFVERDNIGSSNPWCDANYDTVAYYMDPRNFLSDMYIFQFMGLSYDSNVDDETYINLINEVFKDDYLSNFSEHFLTAGKESGVSPIYLSSLSRQEIANGSTPGTAINGEYNGMYNFYNIGATGGEKPVFRGLDFASYDDIATLRPWNEEYKAIVGGALWMGDMYISMGQDTSYFKKWNVIYYYLKNSGKVSNPYTNFNHEYMTNVKAPSSEAVTTYKSYSSYGLLDLGFIFYIPVYNNMPDITNLPTKGGWPNNFLSMININGNDIPGFDGDIVTYNYYQDINNNKITIDAKSVNSTATIEGLGTFDIEEDTSKIIKVTAQNGNVKEYTINITLTGTKLEDPVDVQTTLNNAGIKNGDKYLSGFEIGSDISIIKTKILNANSEASVVIKDKDGNEKESGLIATGDLVTVTFLEDTKTYEVVVYGDANGDGEVNAIDYVRIRKYIMDTANLSDSYKEAADVNKDGEVDSLDYVRLRKYIMNTATIEQ